MKIEYDGVRNETKIMKKKIMLIALTGGLILGVTACNGVGAENRSMWNLFCL